MDPEGTSMVIVVAEKVAIVETSEERKVKGAGFRV